MSEHILCKLRFQCLNSWEKLDEIENQPKKRYCSDCSEIVHFIESSEDFREAQINQWCIAFDCIENVEQNISISMMGYINNPMPD